MGHLLKIKCVDSRVNVHILASTSVPFTLTTVQVPNLALTHAKRITVQWSDPCRDNHWLFWHRWWIFYRCQQHWRYTQMSTTPSLGPLCHDYPIACLHRKKKVHEFPVSSRDVTNQTPSGQEYSVMTSLFPPWESLVVTSGLGTGNSRTFFLRCIHPKLNIW